MAHPVIPFPQPPPTSNTLTSHQREQLLRSTRKLTKLLGSTPHLIDYDRPLQVYFDLSNKLQFVSKNASLPRISYETPRSPSPTSSISSVSTTASRIHHKTLFPSRSDDNAPQDALDSSFTNKQRPPMLRLASPEDGFSQPEWARTKLDTVPGSSPAVGDCHSSLHSSPVSDTSDGGSTDHLLTPISSPASPIPPSVSLSYTLPVPRRGTVSSPLVETSEPTFKVTSEAATRRLKMERIRKRLGECVPVDAVFPHESPDGEDEDGDYVQVATEKRPTQVNVDVRPWWKSSSAVVAFDVIYECPDEHGDEGLANGLSLASSNPKSSAPTSPKTSNTTFPRQWGKLVRRTRKDPRS